MLNIESLSKPQLEIKSLVDTNGQELARNYNYDSLINPDSGETLDILVKVGQDLGKDVLRISTPVLGRLVPITQHELEIMRIIYGIDDREYTETLLQHIPEAMNGEKHITTRLGKKATHFALRYLNAYKLSR